jgi:hypothetical protein
MGKIGASLMNSYKIFKKKFENAEILCGHLLHFKNYCCIFDGALMGTYRLSAECKIKNVKCNIWEGGTRGVPLRKIF